MSNRVFVRYMGPFGCIGWAGSKSYRGIMYNDEDDDDEKYSRKGESEWKSGYMEETSRKTLLLYRHYYYCYCDAARANMISLFGHVPFEQGDVRDIKSPRHYNAVAPVQNLNELTCIKVASLSPS